MTWKQRFMLQILLLVAYWFADDEQLREEIKRLRTDAQVNAPKV